MPHVLTEQEKDRIRYHLGYPSVQPAASLQFGLPAPIQTAFLVESAMNNIMPVAIPRIQQMLQVLDDLEQKLVDSQCYLVADSLEEITLAGSTNQKAGVVTDRYESEYRRWASRLADVMGVPLYPFSKRFAGGGSRSGNVRVT